MPRATPRTTGPTQRIDGAETALLAKRLEVDRGRVVPMARLSEDLGASPLALIQVALALEERFDIQIAEREVEDFVTVEDVMKGIVRGRNSRTARPPSRSTAPVVMENLQSVTGKIPIG